jgi:ferredoxin
MKIEVDWDLCQGHANCMGDAPEVFRVDAQGKLTLLVAEVPEDALEHVESAVRYCPTGALRLAK